MSTFFNDFDEILGGVVTRQYREWARWSGTSFSAPKVAAAIAREMYLFGGTGQGGVEAPVDAEPLPLPRPRRGVQPLTASAGHAGPLRARRCRTTWQHGSVIVDGAWYVDGRRTLDSDSVADLAAERGKGGFGWLGLRMPTDDELNEAAKAFDIPELAIADARHKHDRPKIEVHDGCLMAVVPTARYVDDREEVEFGELFFYVGRDYLVTVRYGQAAPLAGVRAELERHPELLRHGPGAVLQAALLHAVEAYGPVVDGLENDVREVERDVFSETRDQPTRRIYFLIREVLDFLIALEPLSAAMKRLTGPECLHWVAPEIVPLFRDVDEALAGIVERGRTVHQLLNNALAASMTQASMRQNEDMRRISAWVAIGVIPTMVAGLFGMNLGGIPGGAHVLGFTIVCALTALVSLLVYRKLRGEVAVDRPRSCTRSCCHGRRYGSRRLLRDRIGRIVDRSTTNGHESRSTGWQRNLARCYATTTVGGRMTVAAPGCTRTSGAGMPRSSRSGWPTCPSHERAPSSTTC